MSDVLRIERKHRLGDAALLNDRRRYAADCTCLPGYWCANHWHLRRRNGSPGFRAMLRRQAESTMAAVSRMRGAA